MSLSIRATSIDGVMVVALAGTADATMLSPLQAPLSEALADTPLVILDLDQPDGGIDVDALRALLVGLLDEARGGELRIAARDPELRRELAMARIHHLVAVHETVADATHPQTRDIQPDDAAASDRGRTDDRPGFTVARTAIPLAVHCRGCGRLLLPARLWPLAIRSRPDGHTQVELRCVRCHALGSLVLDPSYADHRTLLTLWSEARPGCETHAPNTGGRGLT